MPESKSRSVRSSSIARHRMTGRERQRMSSIMQSMVERLESRLLLSAISWIGGTGDWSVAGNWSGGVVPGYGDDVTLPAGADVTISTCEAANTLSTAPGSTLTSMRVSSFLQVAALSADFLNGMG